MQEHDSEPQPGLPQALPDGEQVLWQGRSDYRSLLRGSFHVPVLAAYFIVLLVLRTGFRLAEGHTLADSLAGAPGLAVLAVLTVGMLLFYARLLSRATLFTLTNRRVVIRSGVAVPVTANLPYSKIQTASVRRHRDGSADIALAPEPGSRASYVLLWPMVKPWRVLRVQPLLRGVPDGERVAGILADALAAAATSPQPVRQTETANEASPVAEVAATPKRSNWNAYPTVPLAAAVSLVVLTLVSVTWSQLTDDRSDDAARASIAASIDLRFSDRDDGAVVVRDASDGRVIDVLLPGTNGFLRSTLRTFVRARRAVDTGMQTPFRLIQTTGGQLLLSDPETGQEIDLWAFGKTNARAFGRFLEDAAVTDADTSWRKHASEAGSEVTAVAMSKEETSQ